MFVSRFSWPHFHDYYFQSGADLNYIFFIIIIASWYLNVTSDIRIHEFWASWAPFHWSSAHEQKHWGSFYTSSKLLVMALIQWIVGDLWPGGNLYFQNSRSWWGHKRVLILVKSLRCTLPGHICASPKCKSVQKQHADKTRVNPGK